MKIVAGFFGITMWWKTGNGNLISAGIPSCNSDPCLFILGADVTVELNFTACMQLHSKSIDGQTNRLLSFCSNYFFFIVDDAEHVEDLIKGIVRGKELPFPEPTKNLCDGYLTPGCPLKKGQDYVFRAIFKVKPFYPAVS